MGKCPISHEHFDPLRGISKAQRMKPSKCRNKAEYLRPSKTISGYLRLSKHQTRSWDIAIELLNPFLSCWSKPNESQAIHPPVGSSICTKVNISNAFASLFCILIWRVSIIISGRQEMLYLITSVLPIHAPRFWQP